jgi:hypothetical protein
MEIGKFLNDLPVGLQPTDVIRGESWDPFLKRSKFSNKVITLPKMIGSRR